MPNSQGKSKFSVSYCIGFIDIESNHPGESFLVHIQELSYADANQIIRPVGHLRLLMN